MRAIDRIQNTAVNRFQPIPGIGQSTRHDHAHGVIQIGVAHLGIYINLLDIPIIGLDILFSHNFLFTACLIIY